MSWELNRNLTQMTRSEKTRDWTKAEVELLIKLCNERVSRVVIARELKRYIASVKRQAGSLCLQLSP